MKKFIWSYYTNNRICVVFRIVSLCFETARTMDCTNHLFITTIAGSLFSLELDTNNLPSSQKVEICQLVASLGKVTAESQLLVRYLSKAHMFLVEIKLLFAESSSSRNSILDFGEPQRWSCSLVQGWRKRREGINCTFILNFEMHWNRFGCWWYCDDRKFVPPWSCRIGLSVRWDWLMIFDFWFFGCGIFFNGAPNKRMSTYVTSPLCL